MVQPQPAACSIVDVAAQRTAVIKARVRLDEIPATQRALRPKVRAAAAAQDAGPLGHTCTLWHMPVDGRMYMEPGIIVARDVAPQGEVVPSELPAGRAAHYLMVGPYDGLPDAWGMLLRWCAAQKLTAVGVNWEIYDETTGGPGKPQTALYALLA